jgi:hypothetical protein
MNKNHKNPGPNMHPPLYKKQKKQRTQGLSNPSSYRQAGGISLAVLLQCLQPPIVLVLHGQHLFNVTPYILGMEVSTSVLPALTVVEIVLT